MIGAYAPQWVRGAYSAILPAMRKSQDETNDARTTSGVTKAFRTAFRPISDSPIATRGDYAAYRAFRRGFHSYWNEFIGGQWCGMFIGIERDGYTHS